MVRLLLKLSVPLLFLVLAVATAVPCHAGKKLVAAVLSSDSARYKEAHRALVKTLAMKGFDQSKVEFIVQTPNPDPISWSNTIRKFNGIGSDIIITYGAPVTLAAIREADTIPIVFVDVYGPVETGITRSMSVPGRNLTGVSSKVPMITLLKAANEIQRIKTLGVLYNSREVGSVVQLKEVRRVAAQLGFSVTEISLSSIGMLDQALDNLVAAGVTYIYASENALVTRHMDKIIAKAREHGIPVISHIPDSAEKGALVTLEVNGTEQGQLAGEAVYTILHARKQGPIPVATPKKVDLIVNLRAARIFDFNVPIQVLNLATKIIK